MVTTISRPSEGNLELVLVYFNNKYIGTTTKDAVSIMLTVMGINLES